MKNKLKLILTVVLIGIAIAMLVIGVAHAEPLGNLGRNSEVLTPKDEYWTMIVIPDSQRESDNAAGSANLTNMVDWITSMVNTDNVQAIVHVGDIANVRPGDSESTIRGYFENAIVLTNLYGLGVPVAMAVGNHDYNDALGTTNKATYINDYWVPSLYNSKPWFGGARVTGEIQDSYYVATIDEVDYLFLVLDNSPNDTSLEWANGVCRQYPKHKVVVIEHDYLAPLETSAHGRTYSGRGVYNEVVDVNGNANLVLCGHVGNVDGGINALYGISRYQESSTRDGGVVSELVQNYQSVTTETHVRVLRIYKNGWVNARVYYVQGGTFSTYSEHNNNFQLGARDTHAGNIADKRIAIDNAGIYGYWEFENLYSGNEIRDWSGNGNNGVLGGGSLTNGAFLCTNKETHITIAGLYQYGFPDGMTAFAEFELLSPADGVNSMNEVIGTKHFGGGGHGISLGFDSAKVPKGYIQGANYLNAKQDTDYKAFDGFIHRAVATYDGAIFGIWWNGEKILETNFVAGAFTDVSGLVIGNWPNFTDGGMPVLIHKAAFFTNSIPEYDAFALSAGASIVGLSAPIGGITKSVKIPAVSSSDTNRFNFINGVLSEQNIAVPDLEVVNGSVYPVTSFSTNANGSYHVTITNEATSTAVVLVPEGTPGYLFKNVPATYRLKIRFDGTLRANYVRVRSVIGRGGNEAFGVLNEVITDNDRCELVYEFTLTDNTTDRYIQFGTTSSEGWMDGDLYIDLEEIEQ